VETSCRFHVGKWRRAWAITARLESEHQVKRLIFATMQQTMYLKAEAYYNGVHLQHRKVPRYLARI
jgi:hypothetical protein